MLLLLTKLLLAPALVVGSSLAGRRWGPKVAGLLVSMPVTAGPVLLIVALEHNHRFTEHTARAALLGLVGLAAFAVVFTRTGQRSGWATALATGYATFLLTGLLLAPFHLPAEAGLLIAVAAFFLARRLMPPGAHAESAQTPAWDLPARALATATLVLTLTALAGQLGPSLTGVYTPAPLALGVLAGFALKQGGPGASAALLGGFLDAAYGFATFFFVVAILIERSSVGVTFSAALAAAALVALASYALSSRSSP